MNIKDLDVYSEEKQKDCLERIKQFNMLDGNQIIDAWKTDFKTKSVETVFNEMFGDSSDHARKVQSMFPMPINKVFAEIVYNSMLYIKKHL